MKIIVQDPFSIKKVLIFGSFGLCRFQHKVGMNSFPMRMNVFSYGTKSFPWGMYSFRSKIPIVLDHRYTVRTIQIRYPCLHSYKFILIVRTVSYKDKVRGCGHCGQWALDIVKLRHQARIGKGHLMQSPKHTTYFKSYYL